MGNENRRILSISGPVECTIVQRINRFVVEVEIRGELYRTSINNTGRLEQFLITGKGAFCIRHQKPGKTDFRLFAIEDGEQAAIIDTRLQMQAFEKALESQAIPWLEGFRMVKRDEKLGNSRIDYLLEGNGEQLYLEVKSAVLRDGRYAMYPDCPTARGRKHIRGLTDHVCVGGKATILFLAALPEVSSFKPYRDGDSELCDLLIMASKAGVEVRSIGMAYHPEDSAIHLYNADVPVA